MGYLIGFLPAVFLAGYLRLDNWMKAESGNIIFFFINLSKLILSVSLIYLFGLVWLSNLIGFEKAILFGFKPFWIAELFKIMLLAFLTPLILKFKKFI